jgi:hypothetical protein
VRAPSGKPSRRCQGRGELHAAAAGPRGPRAGAGPERAEEERVDATLALSLVERGGGHSATPRARAVFLIVLRASIAGSPARYAGRACRASHDGDAPRRLLPSHGCTYAPARAGRADQAGAGIRSGPAPALGQDMLGHEPLGHLLERRRLSVCAPPGLASCPAPRTRRVGDVRPVKQRGDFVRRVEREVRVDEPLGHLLERRRLSVCAPPGLASCPPADSAGR